MGSTPKTRSLQKVLTWQQWEEAENVWGKGWESLPSTAPVTWLPSLTPAVGLDEEIEQANGTTLGRILCSAWLGASGCALSWEWTYGWVTVGDWENGNLKSENLNLTYRSPRGRNLWWGGCRDRCQKLANWKMQTGPRRLRWGSEVQWVR